MIFPNTWHKYNFLSLHDKYMCNAYEAYRQFKVYHHCHKVIIWFPDMDMLPYEASTIVFSSHLILDMYLMLILLDTSVTLVCEPSKSFQFYFFD